MTYWAEPAAQAFATLDDRLPWRWLARPEQLAPDWQWLVWLYLAGRGAGKTRSAAEQVTKWAEDCPQCRIALVGRIPADVRDVMIEGESGLLAVARAEFRPVYEPTKRRLTWPNGSTATAYSSTSPDQLRGPQHHFAWGDEAAAWKDAIKGDVVDTTWNNLMLGLRLGRDPRAVVTTTPKPNKLIRELLKLDTTASTRGTTYDNLGNLAPTFRAQILRTYEGTRVGRQELNAELLEDVEGALWTQAIIEAGRIRDVELPDLQRVIVAVDPSGSTDGDLQGIVAAAIGVDGEFYVLADRSCSLSPNGWASRAIALYREYSADRIVAEKNFGGDMVESTIRQVDRSVPVKMVPASRGKVIRAEPIAALYEQNRVHHVGALPQLEDQMSTWTPQDGTSPDRMDALVWALTELAFGAGQGATWLQYLKNREAEKGAA